MFLPLALLLLRGSWAMPRVPLQEAAEKTLCPYSYRQDIIEARTPRIIHKVECHDKDTLREDVTYVDSNSGGHFNRTCRCTEIYSTLTVTYRLGGVLTTREAPFPVACACVNLQSLPVTRLDPTTVTR